MNTKKERLSLIEELVKTYVLTNQEDLLPLLREKGFEVTQATLSRDMKQLKIIKSPDAEGNYVYTLPSKTSYSEMLINSELITRGFLSLDFSDKLGVIKTRPGYAMGIASDIDNRLSNAVLGTIAGDDTILIIPREGFNKKQITQALMAVLEEK
jgi:transcriptional regulator of arginine metabolism